MRKDLRKKQPRQSGVSVCVHVFLALSFIHFCVRIKTELMPDRHQLKLKANTGFCKRCSKITAVALATILHTRSCFWRFFFFFMSNTFPMSVGYINVICLNSMQYCTCRFHKSTLNPLLRDKHICLHNQIFDGHHHCFYKLILLHFYKSFCWSEIYTSSFHASFAQVETSTLCITTYS